MIHITIPKQGHSVIGCRGATGKTRTYRPVKITKPSAQFPHQ